MIQEIDNGIFEISVNIDGDWWTDKAVSQWMNDLKRNTYSSYNSRKTYARAVEIFLHYYIYCPQSKKQSLYDYLLKFREALRVGFTISTERKISTSRIVFQTLYKVLEIKPLSIASINTYFTGIQWYLTYLKEKNINNSINTLFSNEVDWSQLRRKSINSAGGGYGLMMGPLLAQILGPKKKLINNIKIDRASSEINNYFPPELFFDLLEFSEPREQAIYLLCGCAGTRIGQALSLTRDDYSYDTQEVFIVDPLSDEKGPQGKIARFRLLRDKYNINMEENPYKYIACKYPIPSQYSELLWINPDFKMEFFHALAITDKGNPIKNKHPFVFNTKSGKILTPNESHNIFKKKVMKLTVKIQKEWDLKRQTTPIEERIHIDTEYEYLISQLNKVKGLHSLRHMYAIMWADLAAIDNDIDISDLMALCQYGLGQSSISSVMQYFTLRKKTRLKISSKLLKGSQTQDEYTRSQIKIIRKYKNRSKYETHRN